MSIDELLASAAAAARALMVDRCDISRPTGLGTLDDATGTVRSSSVNLGVDLPCRVKPAAGQRDTDAAGQALSLREYVVWLPLTADVGVRVGDIVTVTRSRDWHLQGRPLRVTASTLATTAGRRVLTVTDEQE